MIVLDASVVVAALIDAGDVGQWAAECLTSDDIAAPHLMPVEVGNLLRRSVLHGAVSSQEGAQAHADLLDLAATLFPYRPFGHRVWELRANVTAYDAWYIALAEALDADLATLDTRLASASGPRCRFLQPPTGSLSS